MKNKYIAILGLGIVAFIAIYLLYPAQRANGELDSFAQCLADKGVTMYGADWCPHCQNEKRAFGDSFRLVPYVECPDNPKQCLDAGINGYPTWIFHASPADEHDEKRLVGEQGLKRLSQESDCILPSSKK